MNKKKEMKTDKKLVSRFKVASSTKKTPSKKVAAKKGIATKEASISRKKISSKKYSITKQVLAPKKEKIPAVKVGTVNNTATKRVTIKEKKATPLTDKKVLVKTSLEDDLLVEVVKKERKDEKGVFLVVESKKTLRWLASFLVILIGFLIFNSISLLKTNRDINEYLETVKKIDEMLNKDKVAVVEESKEVVAPGWRSFGDNFSSTAYLDNKKTDMFLDTSVTALTFPPVFSLDKVDDQEVDSSWTTVGLKDSCYLSPSDICLEVVDNVNLLYNKQRIDLPREMANEKIRRIDSSFLSSIFVLSFSVEEGVEERVYSYTFDGRRYRPLIGKDSAIKIVSKYGRGGGVMVAGGVDDDFILFYSGYEGYGYHFKAGEFVDISQFFGLRVVDSGFYPYVIKQGEGADSLWYILSLSEEKPKLIKLWQNETSEIVGAIDLSYIFKDFSGFKLVAFKEIKEKRGEFMFSFSSSDNSLSLGLKEAGTWLFKDGGFDNSTERRAVSSNLNYTNTELTTVAVNELSCNANEGLLDFYFIGSDNNRLKFDFKNEIKLLPGNNALYWEAVFKPGKSLEYSPFFDHINSLQFFVTGK